MIPAIYYHGIFYTCILILCMVESIRIHPLSANTLLYRRNYSEKTAILLSVILVFFIGTRPIDRVFADTVGYAQNIFDLII